MTVERIEGPGGGYTLVAYMDEHGGLVAREEATRAAIREFDAEGNMLSEAFGSLGPEVGGERRGFDIESGGVDIEIPGPDERPDFEIDVPVEPRPGGTSHEEARGYYRLVDGARALGVPTSLDDPRSPRTVEGLWAAVQRAREEGGVADA